MLRIWKTLLGYPSHRPTYQNVILGVPGLFRKGRASWVQLKKLRRHRARSRWIVLFVLQAESGRSEGRFCGFPRPAKIVVSSRTSFKNQYFACDAFGMPCQAIFHAAKHATMRIWDLQRGLGAAAHHRFSCKNFNFLYIVAPASAG